MYLWRRGQGRVHIRNGEFGLGVSVVQERVVNAVPLCLVFAKVKLLLTIASEKGQFEVLYLMQVLCKNLLLMQQ